MQVIDAYLFVKRFVAHATDGELSREEWRQIVADLRDDIATLGVPEGAAFEALSRVEQMYNDLGDDPAAAVKGFHGAVAFLRDALEHMPAAKDRIIEQLWDLAAADGWIHDMERHFIETTERSWQGKTRPV